VEKVTVELLETNVERGFIDFARRPGVTATGQTDRPS